MSGRDIHSNQNRMNLMHPGFPNIDLLLNSLNTSQICLSGVDSQTDMVLGINSKVMSPMLQVEA